MYTPEENQIIQTYMSFKFLYELHATSFVNTEAYDRLDFSDKFVHENMKKQGVMNQGMIPPILYMLLVMPKETLGDSLSKKYDKVNDYISSLNLKPFTDYVSDNNKVDYIRHMRNAISHMRIALSTDCVTFSDSITKKNKQEIFNVSMSYIDLGKTIEQLNYIFIEYIEEIKARQQQN